MLGSTTDCVFSSLLKRSAIFSLHRLDLDLLLGDFFPEELNSLRLLLITRPTNSILTDLQVQFIQLSLGGALSSPFILELRLKLVVPCLEGALLAI